MVLEDLEVCAGTSDWFEVLSVSCAHDWITYSRELSGKIDASFDRAKMG